MSCFCRWRSLSRIEETQPALWVAVLQRGERSLLTHNLQGRNTQKTHLDELSVVVRRWPTEPSASALLSSTEDTLTQETSSSAFSPRTDQRYMKHLVIAAVPALLTKHGPSCFLVNLMVQPYSVLDVLLIFDRRSGQRQIVIRADAVMKLWLIDRVHSAVKCLHVFSNTAFPWSDPNMELIFLLQGRISWWSKEIDSAQ